MTFRVRCFRKPELWGWGVEISAVGPRAEQPRVSRLTVKRPSGLPNLRDLLAL